MTQPKNIEKTQQYIVAVFHKNTIYILKNINFSKNKEFDEIDGNRYAKYAKFYYLIPIAFIDNNEFHIQLESMKTKEEIAELAVGLDDFIEFVENGKINGYILNELEFKYGIAGENLTISQINGNLLKRLEKNLDSNFVFKSTIHSDRISILSFLEFEIKPKLMQYLNQQNEKNVDINITEKELITKE